MHIFIHQNPYAKGQHKNCTTQNDRKIAVPSKERSLPGIQKLLSLHIEYFS
eukprot:c17240_g1_i1 orf=375-527(+)